MIQPQELRIGNRVMVTRLGIKIPAIVEHGREIDNCIIEEWEGIPITMEWLTRLGFKPDAKMPWLMENGALMCNTGNHWIWHWSGRVIKEIKHVHELQNVMFALSGRELEIKSYLSTGS